MSANNEKADDRRQRLAAELRANLKRRKAKGRTEPRKDAASPDPDPKQPR